MLCKKNRVTSINFKLTPQREITFVNVNETQTDHNTLKEDNG